MLLNDLLLDQMNKSCSVLLSLLQGGAYYLFGLVVFQKEACGSESPSVNTQRWVIPSEKRPTHFHLFLSFRRVTRTQHIVDVKKGFTRLPWKFFHSGQVPGVL